MNQIIIDYLSNGLALIPIPKGKKGPTLSEWNSPNMAITDIARASEITGNVGLAHAYCTEPTAALDIDNYTEAKQILANNGVDLDALYDADDAVRIESGRANRGKLLFKLPPCAQPVETYKHIDNNGNAIFELRCASRNKKTVQDVLPPSIHPDTGKPYMWGGNGHWSKLPIIPIQLIFAWQNILKTKSCHSQNEVSLIGEVSQETINELKRALMHLSADNRELWVKMGLALKNLGDKGFNLWLGWSATSSKFDSKDATRVWKSLTPTAIDYRSVFSEAQKKGWKTVIKITNTGPALTIPSGFTAEDLSKKHFHPCLGSFRISSLKDVTSFPQGQKLENLG